MDSAGLATYFREQQIPLQWLPFLGAMAAELADSNEPAVLQELFFRIGNRFADETRDFFGDATTLGDVEHKLNNFWSRINWGWLRFTESPNHIAIAHHAAPLAEAFGDEALPWSSGFLAGFYQKVFDVLGAGQAMSARFVGASDDGLTLHFVYGRQ